MASLKQAKVLRAMLHLGNFTAKEVADQVGETPAYIMNLVTKWKGLWLEEYQIRRSGRVGAPETELYVRPEREQDILAELAPVYDEDARLNAPVYQFVDPYAANNAYCRQVQILNGGVIEVLECKTEAQSSKSAPAYIRRINLDSTDVAAGLAAVVKRSVSNVNSPVAVVNLREKVTHLAIMEGGQVGLSVCFRKPRTAKHSKWDDWAIKIAEPMKAFEDWNETKISHVYLTGNLEDLRSIRSAVARTQSRTCSVLDAAKGHIRIKGEHTTGVVVGVKCAAEIGYAVEDRLKYIMRTKTSANRTLTGVGKA
ncbi:MAG TPA: hypothetical protein VKH81_23060 [Candidatus Angelobacter sp.]|nr:hypothetical protein [Candidatus Angelobacter sp.]